jgi:DNA-binding GntR family transcriptional regulator
MTETAPVAAWAPPSERGHRTLAERAFSALHDGIVSGQLAPGQRLRIDELAGALQVSHLPIREAIRQLESRGLVQHTPHRGARVTELSLDDLQQIYDVRLLIEPEVIRRAAGGFTSEDAAIAEDHLRRHTQSERQEPAALWQAHTDFHFALYRAARSTWFVRLITPLWESSQRYRLAIPTLSSAKRSAEAAAEHEELLASCVAHDSERAAAVLHDHLAKTANLIIREMGGDESIPLIGT